MKVMKGKTSFVREEHQVLGGKGVVLRTGQSGKTYQFRMWIPEEKKYIRESLKTKDLETAIQRAEDRIFQVFGDIKSGKKLFGINLEGIVKLYLSWREEDVVCGNITRGRHDTLRSQLKHFLNCKGEKTKISELHKNSYYEYANWCRTHRNNVKDVTIRNEQATINHLIKYEYREGYSHIPEFEFRPIKIRVDEDGRRGTFTLEQYDKLVKKMRTWTSKKVCGDDIQQKNERLMVRDCI